MPTAESILTKIRAFLDGTDTNLHWEDVLAEIGEVEWDMPAGKTVLLCSGNVMETVGEDIRFGKTYMVTQAMRAGMIAIHRQ